MVFESSSVLVSYPSLPGCLLWKEIPSANINHTIEDLSV